MTRNIPIDCSGSAFNKGAWVTLQEGPSNYNRTTAPYFGVAISRKAEGYSDISIQMSYDELREVYEMIGDHLEQTGNI